MRFHSRLGLGLWFIAIAGAPTLLGDQLPAPPSLGSADSFAVLGGSSVTSTGSTVVTGNLGVSPGNTISGAIAVKVGATYRNDSVARQAQRDATSAYNNLAGRTCTTTLSTIPGSPLGPGVYCFTSSAQLTGTLILDAANDPNAVWIFKIGTTLTTTAGSSVRVINGGYENNIFWQVGDSATLSKDTTFLGNVLAHKDITLHSGATVSGRLLAQGAVFLDGNKVSLCCGHITLLPATLPDGIQDTQYAATIVASGGVERYTYTSDPPLPLPGMTLSADSGVLSGKPTTAGRFTFTVTATDDTHVCSGTQTYTIEIVCPATTAIFPSAIPPTPAVPFVLTPAKACVPYILKFGDGCTLPHNFVLTPTALPNGPIPSDLQMNGEFEWTPQKSGVYSFTVSDGKFSQLYTITVTCEAIPISPATLPDGKVCARYNQPIKAMGCDPPYTLSLDTSKLPPGLSFPPPYTAIVGIPTTVGSYPFTITATANDDAACSVTSQYAINIICPPITISPSTLPPATTCQRYCVKLTPSCAIGTTEFKVTAGELPPGLALSLDGMLCGKPSAAGTYSWTVSFKDSVSSCEGSVTYKLTVTGLTITPPCPPGATPGVPYSEVLTASGGTAPYTFVLNGALPLGLIFVQTTPTTATISGTPTTPGCFPITVTVTDANGCSTSSTCTLCVAAGGPTLTGWGMVVLSILLVGVAFLMMSKGGFHG